MFACALRFNLLPQLTHQRLCDDWLDASDSEGSPHDD
jgi:hypothetical protein